MRNMCFWLLALLLAPVSGLIPEFLTYKTCVDAPPAFSVCMTNLTVDIGDKVVLNCQVDPRCVIQFMRWYHEPLEGERVLIKDARSASDPYLHTIHDVRPEHHVGRYVCEIGNVMGVSECAAFLSVRSRGLWTSLPISISAMAALIAISQCSTV